MDTQSLTRRRIFTIIHRGAGDDYLSRLYDIFIMVVAFLSIVPMMFKAMTPVLSLLDTVTVYLLFADYVFRWITADYTTGVPGWKPFVRYPFTIFALLDIISILMFRLGAALPHRSIERCQAAVSYSHIRCA